MSNIEHGTAECRRRLWNFDIRHSEFAIRYSPYLNAYAHPHPVPPLEGEEGTRCQPLRSQERVATRTAATFYVPQTGVASSADELATPDRKTATPVYAGTNSSGLTSFIAIASVGHVTMQSPHPMHFSELITAVPPSPSMLIASK